MQQRRALGHELDRLAARQPAERSGIGGERRTLGQVIEHVAGNVVGVGQTLGLPAVQHPTERGRIGPAQDLSLIHIYLNRKLRDVAQDFVDTGQRPETGQPRPS